MLILSIDCHFIRIHPHFLLVCESSNLIHGNKGNRKSNLSSVKKDCYNSYNNGVYYIQFNWIYWVLIINLEYSTLNYKQTKNKKLLGLPHAFWKIGNVI